MKCWICSHEMDFYKKGIPFSTLKAEDFMITDDHYGKTLDLYKCQNCGFVQADIVSKTSKSILSMYQELVDVGYVNTEEQRLIQARKTIEKISGFAKGIRWLDIGAASGNLVYIANKMNLNVTGVEPSKWLCEEARKRHNIRLINGVFPNDCVLPEKDSNKYDAILLIDVIEHIGNPNFVLSKLGVRCIMKLNS